MRVLNFGSLNIDYVYRVERMALPGQTMVSPTLDIYAGGKGANQSMAVARGGGRVCHAGRIGEDGRWLGTKLARSGVECRYLTVDEGRSGLAMIQVDTLGQSAIVCHPGANARIDRSQIDSVLENFSAGDALLLENEINDVKISYTRISDLPKKRKFKILTIGDSFSEQGHYGYQNILSKMNHWEILNIDNSLVN